MPMEQPQSPPPEGAAAGGPILMPGVALGVRTLTDRSGALLAATVAIVLAWLPLVVVHSMAFGRLTSALEQAKGLEGAESSRPETQERALGLIGDLLGACCGLCSSFFLVLLLAVPVTAGAMCLGARCAAGAPGVGALGAGLRRYWATVVVGFVATFVGGGVGALAPTIAILLLAREASASVADAWTQRLVGALLILLLLVFLWLTVRLTFATIRVIDPARPRLGAVASVRWSWAATAGMVQAPLMLLLTVGALVAFGAAEGGARLALALGAKDGWAAQGAVAGTFVIGMFLLAPPALAVLGACYHLVAQRVEPESAPAPAHAPPSPIRKAAP